MTDTSSSSNVFRCPSCSRPTPQREGRCRHCFTNFATGQTDGVTNRVIEGGTTSLLLLGGSLVIGFGALIAIAKLGTGGAAAPDIKPVQTEAAVIPPVHSFTAAQRSMICRAGIAAEFGRSPKIMTASDQGDGIMRVQYRRPGDPKLWKSDCMIEGDRIVWRTVDAYPSSGLGRWRTTENDDVLTFTLNGRAVSTHSSDGSSADETYKF